MRQALSPKGKPVYDTGCKDPRLGAASWRRNDDRSELAISALRRAQLVLADSVEPAPATAKRSSRAAGVLDRREVVEAVDGLEDATGLRMA
jgi:hypothetical protein